MRGVRTHVSDLKRNTVCTTALRKILDTLRLDPYRPRILFICAQIFRAFFKFPTTSGQSQSPVVKTCPKYLNKVTVSIGLP